MFLWLYLNKIEPFEHFLGLSNNTRLIVLKLYQGECMHLLKVIPLSILLASGVTFADKGKGKMHFKKVMKQLDLSNEQIDKLKEFRKSNKGNNKEIRSQMKNLHEELKTKFIANASDDELKAVHTKIKALKSKMADLKFSKMLGLKSILTEEQRVKFMELKKKKLREKFKNQKDSE